ncbi:MAG: ABC transporter permease [Gammaproteobacteria bacterium]
MRLTEQFTAFQTIVKKEMLRFLRIWIQTVLPAGITMTLYFIIFGSLIGSQIGNIGDHTYMEYIVPGIILMSVINNSYSNVVSSFFSAKFQRHIEEMQVSPMPNYIILLGFIFGGVARGLIVGGVVTIVSLMFIDLNIHSIPIAICVVFLTAVLFSIAGIINAVYAKSFDDISIIPTFVLTPLIYLGGVFYSVNMLSDFWQAISLFNPLLYMVNAFRYSFIGVSDINLVTAFTIIILFVISLFSLALYLLNKGIGIRN